MDIVELQLTNFFSHRDTDIKLTGGLVGVFGSNGAGKSSLIVDSITWCLWGKARVGGAGDAMISTGQTFCEVAVSFKVGGNLWRAIRTRVRDSKTTLELAAWKQDRWKEFTGPTLKDTQLLINKVLGMPYEVFRNSSCIEQGQANSFSNLTPAEAASVILDILQLNKYKVYRKLAAEKVSDLSASIKHFQIDIRSLEAQLAAYKDSDKILQEKVESSTKLRERQKIDSALLEVDASYSKVILDKMSTLTMARVSLNAQLNLVAEQTQKVNDQVKVLDDAESAHCPLCKTKLTAKFLTGLNETLAGSIASLAAQKNALLVSLHDNSDAMAGEEKVLRALKLDARTAEATEIEKQLTKLDAEIKAFGDAVASSEAIGQDLLKIQEQFSDANRNLELYTSLQEAFGPKGIPLLVVDNVVKELEVAINNNLKLLADLPLSIAISTQHEGRQGDMVDTFELILNDGLEAKPYANYSGGEKMLIDLAIRLGLSELLARRNNFKVETLIIDEGLGSLDTANQANFFTTLSKLESKFKHILVITHTQVKDCFKQRIELIKENGNTRVDKRTHYRV